MVNFSEKSLFSSTEKQKRRKHVPKKKRIGISLSGGGYRAAIYHTGTLKKLNELGILEQSDVISCISGGSITGACYGIYHHDFKKFEQQMRLAVKQNVIKGILRSTRFLSIVTLLFLIFSFSVYLLFLTT